MRRRLLEVLGEAQQRGFLGATTPVEHHITHAESWERVLPDAAEIADLGSGGGVPGLVLAVIRPERGGALVESQRQRCAFLEWALQELGAEDRWEVVWGRAEELAHRPERRGRYAGAVARAFGPPAVVAECAAGLIRVGGWCSVSEPPGEGVGGAASRWPEEGLTRLGLRLVEVVGEPVRAVLFSKVRPLDPRLPRRTGALRKRPAW